MNSKQFSTLNLPENSELDLDLDLDFAMCHNCCSCCGK